MARRSDIVSIVRSRLPRPQAEDEVDCDAPHAAKRRAGSGVGFEQAVRLSRLEREPGTEPTDGVQTHARLVDNPLLACTAGADATRSDACAEMARQHQQQMGKSCPIKFTHCESCAVLFTSRHGRRYCSNRCTMREYMRRTRKAQTRYWRIANTPRFQQLAEDYFNLRMELRPNAKHREEWKRYYAATHAEHRHDPANPMGQAQNLISSETTPSSANAVSNAIGKMFTGVKLQMEYHKLSGELRSSRSWTRRRRFRSTSSWFF